MTRVQRQLDDAALFEADGDLLGAIEQLERSLRNSDHPEEREQIKEWIHRLRRAVGRD